MDAEDLLKRVKRDLQNSPHKVDQLKGALVFTVGVIVFTILAGFLFRQRPYVPPTGRMDIVSDFPEGVWFNTQEPLSMFDQLRGHVVLLLFNDFNTLSDLEDLTRLCHIDSTFSSQAVICIVISAATSVAMTDSITSQWQIHFPVLSDPDSIAMGSFGVRGLPAVLVIDTASRVSARYYEDWQRVPLEEIINDLLDQGFATRTLASSKYIPQAVLVPEDQ